MKIKAFGLTVTRSKPLEVAFMELSGLVESFRRSKTSGVGGLRIRMSVVGRYGFRKDWQLG